MTEVERDANTNEIRRVGDEITSLLDSVESYGEMVSEISSSRLIRGKRIVDWHRIFNIIIDPEADPAQVNIVLARICEHIETVNSYYTQSRYELTIFKTLYGKHSRNIIEHEVNRKGRRIPSIDTMQNLAEAGMGEKTMVKEYYEFEVEFWANILSKFKSQIDIIKTFAMSNGTKSRIA
jgi:hypothetical protein